MKVRRISMTNFRGASHGVVNLHGDSLLVGENSVGKSTVCEALDLVLGADRMFRRPMIDEYDFHAGNYLAAADGNVPVVRIEVILADLSPEARRKFSFHVQLWDEQTERWVAPPVDTSGVGDDQWCLPVLFVGRYNPQEDDFEGGTFFAQPERTSDDFGRPFSGPGGGLAPFTREDKRLCGFLYLRANRTGTRALNFGRGSLLETIARLETERSTGDSSTMWADTLASVANLKLSDESAFAHVMDEVTSRARKFVNLADDQSVRVHVSELTREHLRDVLRLFIATRPGAYPVPLPRLSTGTVNLMVFALLTYVAELRGNASVIFAMEEPEIALPPHAQRRLVSHVRRNMSQAIVTYHSPYVLDQFAPEDVIVLRRDPAAELSSSSLTLPKPFAGKRYRRDQRQFAEAVLARAVAVVEGATEIAVFDVAADLLAQLDQDYVHPDLDGITFYNAGSDADVPVYAPIFSSLGKRTYGWHDKRKTTLTPEQAQNADEFHLYVEHAHDGIEDLLCSEMPAAALRRFADSVAGRSDYPMAQCGDTPTGEGPDLVAHVRKVLIARKGDHTSYAALLTNEATSIDELPASVVRFLRDMHGDLGAATQTTVFDTVLDADARETTETTETADSTSAETDTLAEDATTAGGAAEDISAASPPAAPADDGTTPDSTAAGQSSSGDEGQL